MSAAQGLWFGTMTIPPGGRTSAHFHEHHETAIYVISGDEVEMYSGEELEVKEICRPGDFLYIPAGLPHVAVNRSQTPPSSSPRGPTRTSRRASSSAPISIPACPEPHTQRYWGAKSRRAARCSSDRINA